VEWGWGTLLPILLHNLGNSLSLLIEAVNS
jgi:hypothetical protein